MKFSAFLTPNRGIVGLVGLLAASLLAASAGAAPKGSTPAPSPAAATPTATTRPMALAPLTDAPIEPPVTRVKPAPAKPVGPVPQLEITERVFNAGKVDRGTVVQHAFELKNTGQAPLTVNAKPGCGCTVVEFDKIIAPGGVGHVHASLETKMFKGDLTKSVTVGTNDPDHPQSVLELVLNVAVGVDVQPQDVVAFDGKQGEVAPIELTASSPDGKAFDILSVESNDPSYSVKVVAAPADGKPAPKTKKDMVASGANRYAIVVTVAKDVMIGRSGVQIMLKTSHAKAAEVPIQLFPNITGDIQAVPDSITIRLSPMAPPESRTQHVSVRGNPRKSFTVTKVESSNPLIKASFKTVSAGTEYDVSITYDGPPMDNIVDAHVAIITDDQDQPVLTVVVYAFPEPQQPAEPGKTE